MKRSGTTLRQGLDRDIYQIVRKLSAEEGLESLSVHSVCEAIRHSNSSLKRRPKVLLEDSINRVLGVLHSKGEEEDDSADSLVENLDLNEIHNSNAMNRSIRKSLGQSGLKSGPEEPSLNGTSQGTSLGRTSVKRREPSIERSERISKRKRTLQERAVSAPTHVSLEDVGGMDSVIEELKEYIILPLRRPKRYIERGLKIPRGILLHGPPGCGKTMLSEAIAAELSLPFIQIAAPSVVSGMSGESEKQLRQHFENAMQMAPCIMFIDEIDAICPKRESAQREMERRIVAQLLTCMDDLALEKNNGQPVIVLAATNRPDSLDPALRRGGRFDTEINMGIPTSAARAAILRVQTRKTRLSEDVDFDKLAKMTPGFVGADLESLIFKAGSASNARYLDALKRASVSDVSDIEMDGAGTRSQVSKAVSSFRSLKRLLDNDKEPEGFVDDPIKMQDFLMALPTVQPSSKREGFATVPDTTWSNIGALREVRKQLQHSIVKPITEAEVYEKFGVFPPAGVLLWGPPGCGKTLLAKAVANESKANFISVKGPELLNKYVGESERAVRQLFFRARSSVPCVIFFDELDALVPRRADSSDASARVVNTLLTELDGVGPRSGIYVIAATNRPDMIDVAMLRPGRFGQHLFVGLPGPDERVEILMTMMQTMPADMSLADNGRDCDGFSGADLGMLISKAVQSAVERKATSLDQADFDYAAAMVKPSVGNLEEYERFKDTLMC